MKQKAVQDRPRLPESTYEAWLGQQTPQEHGKLHRKPVPDLFETWVEKKVKVRAARRAE